MNNKLSREDFRKQKLIEEQRKAGTLPAEIDPETGRDINPHIPQYISNAPWYLKIEHATLKHQRFDEGEKESLDEWYQRGARQSKTVTKYRKGACENCGALTHKTKECLERPRKKGAKWTGKDLQQDEVVQDIKLGFEAKRDRWNGYDPNEHLKLAEDWELIEEKRRQLREQNAASKLTAAASKPNKESKTGDDSDSDEMDEDKYADKADVVGQKLDTKSRTTVRNLRIREDTAKYLHNLDVNSAYYDPKTRSMRENPHSNPETDSMYRGDNFLRYGGDVSHVSQLQSFAWEAEKRSKDLHIQANPTQAELMFKQYQSKKGQFSESQKQSILARYGGEEHLDAPPKELLLAQTENYVEYSQTGRVIKGQEKQACKSKYEEDAYPLNHTSVFGSWWHDGVWGYACCHATLRAAYCGGQAAIDAASHQVVPIESKTESLLDEYVSRAASQSLSNKKEGFNKRLGDGDVSLDSDKLRTEIDKERKRKHGQIDDGKYNSGKGDSELTEEQLEAYRLERQRFDDPMANWKDAE